MKDASLLIAAAARAAAVKVWHPNGAMSEPAQRTVEQPRMKQRENEGAAMLVNAAVAAGASKSKGRAEEGAAVVEPTLLCELAAVCKLLPADGFDAF